MFVRTEALLPVGEETDLRMWLPDDKMLRLRGRVAHMLTPASARALGRHPGMGFELIGGDAASRLRLRTHVDNIRGEITNPGLSTTTQVIVIEPTAPMRARLARALEAAGFKVTSCATATEALEACAVWRPDAIVAASTMGGMTGCDLAYAMAEHSTLSDVPLILTGDDVDLGRLEAYRAGIRDYIPRPFLDEEPRDPRAPRRRAAARRRTPACAAASSTSGSARCCRCSSSSGRAACCSCCGTARSRGCSCPTARSSRSRPRRAMARRATASCACSTGATASSSSRRRRSAAATRSRATVTQLLLEHARTQDEENTGALARVSAEWQLQLEPDNES